MSHSESSAEAARREFDFPLKATAVIGHPLCQRHDVSMWLVSIEPEGRAALEKRLFECPRCQTVTSVEVQFR